MIQLCEALYASPDDPRGLDDWARALGLSERSLTRHFQAETGMTLRTWRRRLRLFRSQELLATGASITTIALELGYASVSAFIAMFRAETGLSPDAYRRSDLSATERTAGSPLRPPYHTAATSARASGPVFCNVQTSFDQS